MVDAQTVIEVKNLVKYFPVKEGIVRQTTIGNVHAVDNISFKVYKGETLGLVGESGCGKTTTGRMLLRLLEPTSGKVIIEDEDIIGMGKGINRVKFFMSLLTITLAAIFLIFSLLLPSGSLVDIFPMFEGKFLVSSADDSYFVLFGGYIVNEDTGLLDLFTYDMFSRIMPDLSLVIALLFLWIFVYFITGITGTILLITAPIYHILNKRPPEFPTAKAAFIIGFSGTFVEWLLMIFVGLSARAYSFLPNYFNLLIAAIGWISLFFGFFLWTRTDKTPTLHEQLHTFRNKIQMVFQDPYSSLNPRMTVYDIISEGMEIYGIASSQKEREEKVLELMDLVGLAPFHIYRYPHEFSGGQRQRIGIARALSVNPRIIVADEPVSALDVSIRAQILNLLDDLQKELGLTYIVIAHDLSVIRHVSDRVAVMYVGKIVEIANTNEIYNSPLHPYTEALISAVPIPDPHVKKQRIILRGDVPTPFNPKPGCRFRDRCNYAKSKCDEEPSLEEKTPGHFAACWFSSEIFKSAT